MTLRRYVQATLWGAGWSFLVAVTSGILWFLLASVGDQGGSQGAKGVCFVATACLVLLLVALVVLLAVAELRRPETRITGQRHALESSEMDSGAERGPV